MDIAAKSLFRRNFVGLAAPITAIATIVTPSVVLACDPGSLFPCDGDNTIGVTNCRQVTNCPTSTRRCNPGYWAWCCGTPAICACRPSSDPRPHGCVNAT